MSERHATSAELELYVSGGLDRATAEAVETHAASCESCTVRLTREARLELAFERVARHGARAAAVGPLRAVAYGAAGLMAMAAALVLWVGRAPSSASAAGEGTTASHAPMSDGAILDARNDALDGG